MSERLVCFKPPSCGQKFSSVPSEKTPEQRYFMQMHVISFFFLLFFLLEIVNNVDEFQIEFLLNECVNPVARDAVISFMWLYNIYVLYCVCIYILYLISNLNMLVC